MAVSGLSLQMDFGDDDVDRPNHYQLLARRPCEGPAQCAHVQVGISVASHS
jgi:hypothetical protein